MVQIVLLIYFLSVNLLGFILMGLDKKYAKREAWRIPEATLFTVALFGGSIGSILGMKYFRHKTQKIYFTMGMPIILILQVLIILIILFLKPISVRIL